MCEDCVILLPPPELNIDVRRDHTCQSQRKSDNPDICAGNAAVYAAKQMHLWQDQREFAKELWNPVPDDEILSLVLQGLRTQFQETGSLNLGRECCRSPGLSPGKGRS
jgi:hypothetical protein